MPELVCDRGEPVVVRLEILRLTVQLSDPIQLPQATLGRRHAVPSSLSLDLMEGKIHHTLFGSSNTYRVSHPIVR